MPHQSNEALRKSIHITFGLGALTLRWLPWWAAAAACVVAVAGNIFILHRVVGRSVARHERGWDRGIVTYPAAVLVLILMFRNQLSIAAIAWVVLAFGDGLATLAGRALRGPALPWNRSKTWTGFAAFLAAGGFGALAIAAWMGHPGSPFHVLLAVLCAAIVESLSLGVEDNFTVPAAAATAMVVLAATPVLPFAPPPQTLVWLGINTVLAVAGYLARSVDVSGAVGGWILGSIIIVAAGWPLYVTLLVFFILGSGMTKLGYARKEAAGLAQEGGGRRGFSHAFSNVGVAAICAIAFSRYYRAGDMPDLAAIIYFMGIASLATAAADTVASEVGQLLGRRAFLPLTFRRVAVGTEGAISLEGTAAGLVAAFVVALAGSAGFQAWFGADVRVVWVGTILATAAAVLGSWLESVAGSWNRKQPDPVPNGVLNFFNTAVGAILLYYMASSEWASEILRKS